MSVRTIGHLFLSWWVVVALLGFGLTSAAQADPQTATVSAPANQVASAPARQSNANAATQWNKVFPNLVGPSWAGNEDVKDPLGLTDDDWEVIYNFARGVPQPSPKQLEQARAAMEKLQPVMDQILATSKVQRCDFEHDYSQGFDLEQPELQPMRQAARILNARSALALTDGNWDAYLESAGAAVNLSKQISQTPLEYSSLVAAGTAYLPQIQAQQLVDGGLLTPEKAAQLLEKLEPLRGKDPYGFSATTNQQFSMYANSKLDGNYFVSGSLDSKDNDRLKDLDPAAIHEAILPLQGIYREGAAAILEPNKEAALKRWNAALATVDKLPDNSQALMHSLAESIEFLVSRRFAYQERTAALTAVLKGIASGKLNPDALASPAIWWSRAAAAARALSDEQQSAVVLLQLNSLANDSPLRPVALDTIAACDATVLECMRRAMACESKVVSFQKLTQEYNPLDLALIGGLRGAARVAMAKSMLPELDAEQSLSFLSMAIASSNALTSDPSLAHALASQCIADEAAAAIGHFSVRRDVTDELRSKLNAAIAAMPRSDAFGFRAALKNSRGTLASSMRWRLGGEDDAYEILTKSLAVKPAPWICAVEILYNSDHAPILGPEGSLVSTDDLFTPESVKEVAAAWEVKSRQDKLDQKNGADELAHEAAKTTPAQQLVQKYLGKINPPTIRDISLDMNRAAETLAAIDAAAANRVKATP